MAKKGFTLIEILIVITIAVLLLVAILISVSQSKKNARINRAKVSLHTTLSAIIACVDSGGAVRTPSGSEPSGSNSICIPAIGFSGAYWPKLEDNYEYSAGTYSSSSCSFRVNTADDTTAKGNEFLTCDCVRQICE